MLKHVEAMADTELVTIRRQAAEFRASLAYDADFAPPRPPVLDAL